MCKIRQNNKITREQLARDLNLLNTNQINFVVTPEYIKQIETQKQNEIDDGFLDCLCTYFKVGIDDLVHTHKIKTTKKDNDIKEDNKSNNTQKHSISNYISDRRKIKLIFNPDNHSDMLSYRCISLEVPRILSDAYIYETYHNILADHYPIMDMTDLNKFTVDFINKCVEDLEEGSIIDKMKDAPKSESDTFTMDYLFVNAIRVMRGDIFEDEYEDEEDVVSDEIVRLSTKVFISLYKELSKYNIDKYVILDLCERIIRIILD